MNAWQTDVFDQIWELRAATLTNFPASSSKWYGLKQYVNGNPLTANGAGSFPSKQYRGGYGFAGQPYGLNGTGHIRHRGDRSNTSAWIPSLRNTNWESIHPSTLNYQAHKTTYINGIFTVPATNGSPWFHTFANLGVVVGEDVIDFVMNQYNCPEPSAENYWSQWQELHLVVRWYPFPGTNWHKILYQSPGFRYNDKVERGFTNSLTEYWHDFGVLLPVPQVTYEVRRAVLEIRAEGKEIVGYTGPPGYEVAVYANFDDYHTFYPGLNDISVNLFFNATTNGVPLYYYELPYSAPPD